LDHPFINSLEDKTLEELQTTIASLYSKITYAHRTGNSPLIHQLNMAIDSYKTEYNKKMNNMLEKQNLTNRVNIQTK
jgi:hypothetical protein